MCLFKLVCFMLNVSINFHNSGGKCVVITNDSYSRGPDYILNSNLSYKILIQPDHSLDQTITILHPLEPTSDSYAYANLKSNSTHDIFPSYQISSYCGVYGN